MVKSSNNSTYVIWDTKTKLSYGSPSKSFRLTKRACKAVNELYGGGTGDSQRFVVMEVKNGNE